MSILSILEPASTATPRPTVARLATGSVPATVGSDLLVPLADGRVTDYDASRITTQWYERARAEVHAVVGARPDDQVIFTRQTTDALNLLAHVVPADATVIVFESEHHAALLPWPAERTVGSQSGSSDS